MKKTKILIPALSAVTAAGIILPMASCSCHKESDEITPEVDTATKKQFEDIKFDCKLNKESTINFICAVDEEVDPDTLSITVGNAQLQPIKDFTVEASTVKIYDHAMNSKQVVVKANAVKKEITPILEGETTSKFSKINCVLAKNKQSTITFIPFEDQELDASTVSIKVGDTTLELTKDYKIEGNKITIYSQAMNSRSVTLSASSKMCHVIKGLACKWFLKPLMTNDNLSCDDFEITLEYKDGQSDYLTWGEEGYWIYVVDKTTGTKTEIKDFINTPYVLQNANTEYNFEIKYALNPEITLVLDPVVVSAPTKSLFIKKYEQCLENFQYTHNDFGWMTFESAEGSSATFAGENVTSAAITYNDEMTDPAVANWKDATGEPLSSLPTFNVGGRSIDDIKEEWKTYTAKNWTISFFNNVDTFGYKVVSPTSPDDLYDYVEFDTNTYIKTWKNTATFGVSKQTDIKNTKYLNMFKTAHLTTVTDSSSPVETMTFKDTIIPTEDKHFVNAVDNEFIVSMAVKSTEQTKSWRGRIKITCDSETVYTSEAVYLTGSTTKFRVKIDDWSKIAHNAELNVSFDYDYHILPELDSSLTDDWELLHTPSPIYRRWDKQDQTADITLVRKDGSTKEYKGTFILTGNEHVPAQADNTILSTTAYDELSSSTVSKRLYFSFPDTLWEKYFTQSIGSTAKIKFVEQRSATIKAGTQLSALGNVQITPSGAISESENPVDVSISWDNATTQETRFGLSTADGQMVYNQTLPAGSKSIKFQISDWSMITGTVATPAELTAEIKTIPPIKIWVDEAHRTDTEYAPYRPLTIVTFYQQFKFEIDSEDPEEFLWIDKMHLTISDFKQVAGPTTEKWFIGADAGHEVQTIGSPDPSYLFIQMFCSNTTPEPDSEYSFTMNFTWETATEYQTWQFKDMRIHFIE